jgi:hypothetical protein
VKARTTNQAAAELSNTLGRRIIPTLLQSMIRNARIKPPRKGLTGAYEWSDDDLAAAQQALAVDRRKREHRQPQAGTVAV